MKNQRFHKVHPLSGPNYHIALFGEVLADVFPDCSVLGGAPFNVARHLRAFGLDPLLISRTGSDPLRDALLEEMVNLGMSTAGIQRDPERPTGQVQVILEDGNHRFEILPDQAYDHICAETTKQTLGENPPHLAYFGTLAQRSAKSRKAAGQFLQACGCPIFLDINLRIPWYDEATISTSLGAADIVKLNEYELATVAGMFGLDHLSPEAQAMVLLQRFDLKQLLVTCGASGSWLLDAQLQVYTASPAGPGQPVVDTVGAGDAFAAVFMLGLMHAWDAPATLQRASDYAAAICRVRGAVPASADFFVPFRQAWDEDNSTPLAI
jgi:fructokinase